MQIKCLSSWRQILPLVPLHSQSNPILALQFYFFNIRYNVILPSMVRSSKRSPSFRFLRQNPECILLSLIRNICWPSNKIWWTVQITKHSFYSFLVSSPLADSSSEPCPWTAWAYVLLSMWQTNFQNHTQEQANMVTLAGIFLQLFIPRCLQHSHFLDGTLYDDTLTLIMVTLSRCCKYRQLSILKLQPSLYSQMPPLWLARD